MRIINSKDKLRSTLSKYRREGKKIGFVPTMGFLHEGHLTLVRASQQDNDITVVSIYVNPTQFGPNEDFKKYPRDLKRDSSMLIKENVDILFVPSNNDIYPNGYLTYIDVEKISNYLCGHFRPGHFKGVATVVAKLLHMVAPDRMYLGQKDAQQVAVLKTMVRDLNFPVEIKAVETIREKDGLAMSSRNKYLNPKERQEASILYQALKEALMFIKQGEHSASKLKSLIKSTITKYSSGKIQYVECVDSNSLESLKVLKGTVLIALAVYFGKTRLIDNVIVPINSAKQNKG